MAKTTSKPSKSAQPKAKGKTKSTSKKGKFTLDETIEAVKEFTDVHRKNLPEPAISKIAAYLHENYSQLISKTDLVENIDALVKEGEIAASIVESANKPKATTKPTQSSRSTTGTAKTPAPKLAGIQVKLPEIKKTPGIAKSIEELADEAEAILSKHVVHNFNQFKSLIYTKCFPFDAYEYKPEMISRKVGTPLYFWVVTITQKSNGASIRLPKQGYFKWQQKEVRK